MDTYTLLLTFGGLVVLAMAWLPSLLHGLPLSPPIVCLLMGGLAFGFPALTIDPDLPAASNLIEKLTEAAVVVSLLGAGLKIDRPFGRRRWMTTWRLLGVTMPLTILAVASLGWGVLGFAPATALLLGALLAPTDPVLAADVQVGPPGLGEDRETRFGLTSEAGLNDGLAFPFVYLAIMLAAHGGQGGLWLFEWAGVYVVWKIAAGVVIGYLAGRFLAFLIFRFPTRSKLADTQEGVAAIGVTFAVYGVAELAQGYGFIAVFVAALTIRRWEGGHGFHAAMHGFAEQIERLLMMASLVILGGAIATGLFADLSWRAAVVGVVVVLVVRPLAGLVGLLGTGLPTGERAALAFFGVRGVGSFYYLAYGVNNGDFGDTDGLWALTGFVVALSIVVHGVSVTPAMRRLEAE